jgi:enoyl-CoA hydratase
MAREPETRNVVLDEARALVANLLACDTPVVSAVRGPAVGAGLAVALLADISIVTPEATLLDGHVRIGVAAGDHAVLVWPLLCGLAKAKRHLLLPDPISGQEAERAGLVSMCVPDQELDSTASDLAHRLASGPPNATRWTKRALNHWLRLAQPAFEASLGYELLGFASAEAAEGLAALRARRPPVWPAQPAPKASGEDVDDPSRT